MAEENDQLRPEVERLKKELGVIQNCIVSYADRYPVGVFAPIKPEDVHKYHAAIRGAGLSVERWLAKVTRDTLRDIGLALGHKPRCEWQNERDAAQSEVARLKEEALRWASENESRRATFGKRRRFHDIDMRNVMREREDAQSEVARLLKLLDHIQWGSDGRCPVCRGLETLGEHGTMCDIGRALGETKTEGSET
jgi:hypothetical protein